jgi:hypothetical protein
LFIVLNIAMFDELLSQLDDALTEAKSLKGPSRSQADSAIDTSALGCDITKPFGIHHIIQLLLQHSASSNDSSLP